MDPDTGVLEVFVRAAPASGVGLVVSDITYRDDVEVLGFVRFIDHRCYPVELHGSIQQLDDELTSVFPSDINFRSERLASFSQLGLDEFGSRC